MPQLPLAPKRSGDPTDELEQVPPLAVDDGAGGRPGLGGAGEEARQEGEEEVLRGEHADFAGVVEGEPGRGGGEGGGCVFYATVGGGDDDGRCVGGDGDGCFLRGG